MKHCTDKTRLWPNAFADVSPAEMDDFIAHAETCPYHAEILRRGEDEFRAAFRLARGLDSEGRILLGDELLNAVAEHDRRMAQWKTTHRAESPFDRLSLYNGERFIIASCGQFFVFPAHLSLHQLNPQAGLQIRARCGSDTDEEVLLGYYALSGVRHEGIEHLLPLDNGFTVGLKIEQVNERNFQLKFRCVENEVIEREKAASQTQPKSKARGASAIGSFFFLSSLQGLCGESLSQALCWWDSLARSLQLGAVSAVALALALCIAPFPNPSLPGGGSNQPSENVAINPLPKDRNEFLTPCKIKPEICLPACAAIKAAATPEAMMAGQRGQRPERPPIYDVWPTIRPKPDEINVVRLITNYRRTAPESCVSCHSESFIAELSVRPTEKRQSSAQNHHGNYISTIPVPLPESNQQTIATERPNVPTTTANDAVMGAIPQVEMKVDEEASLAGSPTLKTGKRDDHRPEDKILANDGNKPPDHVSAGSAPRQSDSESPQAGGMEDSTTGSTFRPRLPAGLRSFRPGEVDPYAYDEWGWKESN